MGAGLATSRRWHQLYDPGMPARLAPDFGDALSMFDAAVAAGPAAPLLYYFDASLTRGEVDELANGLAASFAGLGVGPGDRVALYLQNMPQFVISLIATWKLGAIAVPVNPMLRERELAAQLADSGAKMLVCLQSLYNDVAAKVIAGTPVTAVTTSELDFISHVPDLLRASERATPAGTRDLLRLATSGGSARVSARLAPDDVALLTYTSGTTGPAKGAMNLHSNVAFSSQFFRDWRYIDSSDVILGLSPLFHVTGLVAHIGLSLAAGAPLVLFYRFDPATVLDQIQRQRATFTAGAITAFIALLSDPHRRATDMSSLTKIMSGGAPIPSAVVDEYERETGVYIYNGYGMTEATGPSHQIPVERRAPVDPASGALSIGVPILSTDSAIVDDDGSPLPPGEVGEIVMAGPQVVPGYWNKPAEDSVTFTDGWIRTGDVGFADDAGWFYIVDRRKDIINAAGFKVWPREVEDVLYQHPAVQEAAVVGAADGYRGETVIAFVVLRAGASAEPADLITYCRERMAAYKYPRSVRVVAELPKNASGKVLRRELRQQVASGTDTP
jgi:long-chain acyl-CoA synthetase